ncbi:sugar kinase [Anoxybacter fermentans]|nr:sugar kinase [Anoxybacter fermentans]
MLDVVTLGETMVMMNPQESGSLKYVNQFTKQLGGAESNFAIGLARLGIKVGWISRLGNDSFGDYIEAFIRGEGVDVSRVKRDDKHPTGLMIKERRGLGESKVYYYRHNSAASHMEPDDLDEEYISQAKYLHLTGITPALSDSCREVVYKAIEIAHKYGLKVTFDPNLRLKLWSKEEMRRVILDICSKVDIVLPGLSEGKILLEMEKPEEIIDGFLKLGPKIVVLKVGEKGAIVATKEDKHYVPGYTLKRVIDPIGAGDGFAAGFVAGQIKGYDLIESVKLANAVGAFAVTVKGDVEGLPTWDELQVFLGNKEDIER